jgi:hypothetical protein
MITSGGNTSIGCYDDGQDDVAKMALPMRGLGIIGQRGTSYIIR